MRVPYTPKFRENYNIQKLITKERQMLNTLNLARMCIFMNALEWRKNQGVNKGRKVGISEQPFKKYRFSLKNDYFLEKYLKCTDFTFPKCFSFFGLSEHPKLVQKFCFLIGLEIFTLDRSPVSTTIIGKCCQIFKLFPQGAPNLSVSMFVFCQIRSTLITKSSLQSFSSFP